MDTIEFNSFFVTVDLGYFSNTKHETVGLM